MKKIQLLFTLIFITGCAGGYHNTALDSVKTDSIEQKLDTTKVQYDNNGDTIHTGLYNRFKTSKKEWDGIAKLMFRKGDEFSDTYFYQANSSPKYVNYSGIFLIIAANKKTRELHLAIQYYDADWLLLRRAIFNCDGKNYPFEPDDFKRDNGNAAVWEWSETKVGNNAIPLIVALATSKNAKVKLIGHDYFKIVQITSKEQLAMKNVLKFYQGLQHGYKPQ